MADDEAIGALNQVLSEVIDVVSEVKQARRKVPGAHPLHGQIDQLSNDLGAWAGRLMVQDDALGVSPLASMPSVAGRTPLNLWPGSPTDEEVCQLLDDHLARLEGHVTSASDRQTDEGSRAALDEVHAGIAAHRDALRHIKEL